MEASNMQPVKAATKWYYTPVAVLLVFLVAGPFVLPLIWLSPAFKKWHKVLMTVIVVLFTMLALKAAVTIYMTILREITELQASMGQ